MQLTGNGLTHALVSAWVYALHFPCVCIRAELSPRKRLRIEYKHIVWNPVGSTSNELVKVVIPVQTGIQFV